jgi:hypothetical protein
MTAHPSFTLGTMVTRRGAPLLARDTDGPLSVSSTTSQATTPAAPSPLCRVAVVDHRLGIQRGT